MSKSIKRYEIPTDDKTHELILTGDPGNQILIIGDALVFWAPWNDEAIKKRRKFKIVRTQAELPFNVYRWWGTAVLTTALYDTMAHHLVELRG